MEKLLEELQRQNAEQKELLNNLLDSNSLLPFHVESFSHPDFAGWRVDSARQHEETIEAVRSTAQEQVPFNVQGVSCVHYGLETPSDRECLVP